MIPYPNLVFSPSNTHTLTGLISLKHFIIRSTDASQAYFYLDKCGGDKDLRDKVREYIDKLPHTHTYLLTYIHTYI
jgi:hypothetical protein